MTDKSRAEFDAWCIKTKRSTKKLTGTDIYATPGTIHAWGGWKASRKAALSEAIEACDELETNFAHAGARTESAVAGTCKHIIQELLK